MLRKVIFIFALASLTATGVSAAQLRDLEGKVLVNNQSVGAEIELAPGDRVRVVSGAAKIVYNECAVVNVAPGQTVVVLKHAPENREQCPDAAAGTEAGIMAAGGSGVGLGYIAGGAAVAGGAGLAIALSREAATIPTR